MSKLVGPPQPFRVMGHPIDLSLRFFAGIALIVLAIVRFGWLDGALITCAAWVLCPHAPRVPMGEAHLSDAARANAVARKMDEAWQKASGKQP